MEIISKENEASYLYLVRQGFKPGHLTDPLSSELNAHSQTNWAIEGSS